MDAAPCLCPTCGAPYTAERPRVDLSQNVFICARGSIRITPQQAELLTILIDAMPEYARMETILYRLYGGTEGAEFEVDNIRAQISKLRAALRPLGWKIKNIWHRGYQLARIDGAGK